MIAAAREVGDIIADFPARFSRDAIVQAAIAGALREPEDNDEAQALAAKVAERLDLISEEYERGWTGVPDGEGGYVFEREVRASRKQQR